MHPGIFKKNISTQQSSRMTLEDGGSTTVALEDGSNAVALVGGVGWQFKIAVAALGGNSGRRTCNDGIGISVIKAKGILLQCWHQHQQGQRDKMRTMQGTYTDSNGKEIGVSQQQWWQCEYQDGDTRQEQGDDGMVPDWHRGGKGKARMVLPKR